MNIKIKKLVPEAVIPTYSKEYDAALDLTAVSKNIVRGSVGYAEYGTGLAIQIPEDHVGLLFPRSSISNYGMVLSNSVGVIDCGYTGEVKARFRGFSEPDYKVGDKILQLIILSRPYIKFEEVQELEEYGTRGKEGFGSTGN